MSQAKEETDNLASLDGMPGPRSFRRRRNTMYLHYFVDYVSGPSFTKARADVSHAFEFMQLADANDEDHSR